MLNALTCGGNDGPMRAAIRMGRRVRLPALYKSTHCGRGPFRPAEI